MMLLPLYFQKVFFFLSSNSQTSKSGKYNPVDAIDTISTFLQMHLGIRCKSKCLALNQIYSHLNQQIN